MPNLALGPERRSRLDFVDGYVVKQRIGEIVRGEFCS